MRYIITENEEVTHGPSSWRTIQEHAGLAGNKFPPDMPYNIAGGGVLSIYTPGPAPDPDPVVPRSITKRQLITQCAVDEWITEAQAVAWAESNTLPQLLEDVIAGLPSESRFAARVQALTLVGAVIDDPLMLAVAAEAEADEDALNAFFTAAAAIE